MISGWLTACLDRRMSIQYSVENRWIEMDGWMGGRSIP
jgi:hypothetical protein